MSDTQEKRENNQTLFKTGLTTKHAKECDFGTGSPSLYEAPDMHFVSLHASVLQRVRRWKRSPDYCQDWKNTLFSARNSFLPGELQ